MECGLNQAKDVILESKSLKSLEEKLRSLGLSFRNIGDVIGFSEVAWWRICERENGPMEEYPIPSRLDDLPGTQVWVNGVSYIIHGVLHGEEFNSSTTKQFIKEKTQSYENARTKEDYICEQNLAAFFGVDQAKEMDDVSNFGKVIERPASKLVAMAEQYIHLIDPHTDDQKSEEFQRLCVDTGWRMAQYRKRIPKFPDFFRKIKWDVRYLPWVKEYLRRIGLPGLLRMEEKAFLFHLSLTADVSIA